MKEADRLYIGFRDFVDNERIKQYDEEFFSRKNHPIKFMVSYINKFVNVNLLVKECTDEKTLLLCAFFINVYSVRITNLSRGLKKLKSMQPTYKINFKYDNPE